MNLRLFAAAAVFVAITSARAQDEAKFGLNDAAGSVEVQTDGKLLVAGAFTLFNGAPVGGVIRVNADGTLDDTYRATTDVAPGSRLLLKSNGKLLYYGLDPALNEGDVRPIARLSVNGGADAAFALPGDLAATAVGIAATQSEGRTLLGLYGGPGGYRIIRVNGDGSIDAGFQTVRVFFTDAVTSVAQPPLAIATQVDGKILIGGGFNQVNDVRQAGIARLNVDGTLDATYRPTLTPPAALPTVGGVDTIFLLPDGRSVIGGSFDGVNATPQRNFARLNADGSLDPTFAADPSVTSANPTLLAVQPDGKAIFQLRLVSFSGQPVVRLNADGTRDAGFNVSVTGGRNSRTPAILDLEVEPDGKLVAAGDFTGVNAVVRNNLARLNPDGSVDDTFNAGGGLPALRATVSVVAAREATLENGDQPGVFLVTRVGGDNSADLTVNFRAAGSAIPGVNYQPLPQTSVIIPATRDSAKLRVRPFDDGVHTGNLTVKLLLQPGDYALGSGVQAKVKIVDAE